MRSLEKTNEIRRRWEKAGLCVNCGARQPQPGFRKCEKCRDTNRRAAVARKDRLKQAGLCRGCARRKAAKGRARCSRCLAIGKAATAARRTQRNAARVCQLCEQPRAAGKVLCPACLARHRANYHRRRDRGICMRCDKPCVSGSAVYCKRHRDITRAADRECNRKLREEVFAAYGGYRCRCCGETTPEFLQIDHVKGGGGKHRKSLGSASDFYRWLKRNGFPKGFQVLCANCNHAKGKHGRCPHKVKAR